jgi:hypothetical protein
MSDPTPPPAPPPPPVPTHPIAAIVEAYGDLSLDGGDPVYVSERPAAATNCTVLAPYGGRPPLPTLPLVFLRLQVNVYHTGQQTAYDRAQAAYDALHGKQLWDLGDEWHAQGLCAVQAPFAQPSIEVTGGLLYRVVFNLEMTLVRKDSYVDSLVSN